MNELALVFSGNRRLALLNYDGTPRDEVWEFAEIVTDFLKVPLRRNQESTWFGKKRGS